jgi:SAM-dependent methyltransferase
MDFVSTHNAREMYSRAAWTIGFAVVLYFINRAEYPGPAATLFVVLTLIGLALAAIGYGLNWLATEGQRRVREQILDTLQLQGSERILSLSHELGLEAAKRLKSGKVISLGDTASNEAAREAAKQAGLGDKIRFESGDVGTKLSYPDANFDAVIASGVLSGLKPSAIVGELLRVLKPGAQLVLHQPGDLARDPKLSSATVTPTSLPLGLGGSILSARK